MELTEAALRDAKFQGPTAFYDGADGWARQDFECADEPRFGYSWQRENQRDRGRQFYTVDGKEVPDFATAASLLALPADPDSPRERHRREIDDFHFSPKVEGATRALSEARCNGDAGPFGTVRAWMRRADNGWHQGINAYSDSERTAERPWPKWFYQTKHAAHELYRGMYLFEGDRKSDADLRCGKNVRCRECPILQQVEASMTKARTRKPFPQDIEDMDIDAAKVFTCIGHILTTGAELIDGEFFSIAAHRNMRF